MAFGDGTTSMWMVLGLALGAQACTTQCSVGLPFTVYRRRYAESMGYAGTGCTGTPVTCEMINVNGACVQDQDSGTSWGKATSPDDSCGERTVGPQGARTTWSYGFYGNQTCENSISPCNDSLTEPKCNAATPSNQSRVFRRLKECYREKSPGYPDLLTYDLTCEPCGTMTRSPTVSPVASTDPTCETGIRGPLQYANTCCLASCGTCTGNGCSSRPGRAAGCCEGTIGPSNRSCLNHLPPCTIPDDSASSAAATTKSVVAMALALILGSLFL